MVIERWIEVDGDDWRAVGGEPRGKREKVWCARPGDERLWLRKTPYRRAGHSVDRPEAAIEALTLRLARAAGLRAPESVVCSWTGQERSWGIAIRSFLEAPDEELSLATEELRALDQTYDPNEIWQHTPQRALELVRFVAEQAPGVLGEFFDLLAFDAWVGIGDRHPENWGFIRRPGRPSSLAPIFDTAACLGVELTDAHPLLRAYRIDRAQQYVADCISGFGDGAHALPLATVIHTVLEQRGCRERFRSRVASFRTVMNTVPTLLAQIPEHLLSGPRKHLAAELLRLRLDWIEECSS